MFFLEDVFHAHVFNRSCTPIEAGLGLDVAAPDMMFVQARLAGGERPPNIRNCLSGRDVRASETSRGGENSSDDISTLKFFSFCGTFCNLTCKDMVCAPAFCVGVAVS